MNKPNLKDLVKNNTVTFHEYRKGYFYYTIGRDDHTTKSYKTYKFPVPLENLGDSTLKFQDKAIMFLSYISAAIKEGTLVEIKL
jgi:hypothetical protein